MYDPLEGCRCSILITTDRAASIRQKLRNLAREREEDFVSGIEIKEDADYSGVRITGFANLKNARIPFQADIGYGDAVVPAAEEVRLPVYLDLPAPQLRAYPVYAVIAEKFQAMVMLGIANSRMKDFYDIRVIAQSMILDGNILAQAMKATFETRKTAISTEALTLFSDEFKQDTGKSIQWSAFINKNNITDETGFSDVVTEIQQFIEPIYQAISENRSFTMLWLPDAFCWTDE